MNVLILESLALFYILLSQSINYYYLSTFYWIVISVLSSIPLLVLTATIFFKIFIKSSKKLHVQFRKLRKSSCCQFQKIITSRPVIEKLQESATGLDSDATTKVPDRVLHPQWYNIENNYGSTEQSQDHSA